MECITFGMVAVFMLLVLGGIFWFQQINKQKTEMAWKDLAQRRGLTFQEGSLFENATVSGYVGRVGVLLDIHMVKRGKSSKAYTRATARTPVSLPDGLILQPENAGAALAKLFGGQDIEVGHKGLDAQLRIRGHHPDDVTAFFEDPEAIHVSRVVGRSSDQDMVRDNQVVLHKRGRELEQAEALLDRAVAVAEALANARLRAWTALAEKRNLPLGVGHDEVKLRGEIEGFTVAIRGDLVDGQTHVRVACPAGLPQGLKVIAGKAEGEGLGDPILDRMVRVQCDHRSAARAVLLDEDVHGDLLAVVHAFPGSSLSTEYIDLVLPWGSSPALTDRVDDAVRLAVSLRRAVRAEGPVIRGGQRRTDKA